MTLSIVDLNSALVTSSSRSVFVAKTSKSFLMSPFDSMLNNILYKKFRFKGQIDELSSFFYQGNNPTGEFLNRRGFLGKLPKRRILRFACWPKAPHYVLKFS